MAGVKVYCTTHDELTLNTGATWTTLLMYEAASNVRAKVDAWGVYCRGTVNSDPGVMTRIILASDNGTGGTARTAQVRNDVAETATGTYTRGTYSVEPTTTGQALDMKAIHPQSGVEWPSIEPGMIEIGGGDILLVQYVNNGGGASIPASADLTLEQ